MDTEHESREQVVQEAKLLLMQYRRMTEPEAHRFLQTQAMNQRIPKLIIAQRVIQRYAKQSLVRIS